MKEKSFTTLILIIISLTIQAQILDYDFNNYKPIMSSGTMPEDFSVMTLEKIDNEESIEGLSKSESNDLIKSIHSGIDDILKSGKVTYGDPISNYVTKVGKKILGNDPELAHIRFYMLRSNVVNALSTKQGIIFVTQGLIAQLENEAQLAFILAHEVVHYKHDHVVQGYKERRDISRTQSNNEEKFKKLSYYSREKEYEADSVAVGIYKSAGYSKEELYNVFDVLTYSYLPFEIESVSSDFLNSENLFVPEELFINELPEISAEEDYDDSKSSHPNIKQRKEQVYSVVENERGWGDKKYIVSEEEFLSVRNLARFESVRNDLYSFRYVDALYSIYLLEEDYPNSIYLTRAKAKAWASLIAAKSDSKFKLKHVRPKKIQGPSHQIHQLIHEFSTEQLYSVGLRIIYDAKKKHNEDDELNEIYKYAVKSLAKDKKKFKQSDYKDITYQEALEEFNASKLVLTDSLDSVPDEIENEDEKLSKYEKIRKEKKESHKAKSIDEEFDFSSFHLYALNGILDDEEFIEIYQSVQKEEEIELSATDEDISRRDRLKMDIAEEENRFNLGLESIILLESYAVKYNNRNNVDYDKSYKLELKLKEAVSNMESNKSIDVHSISTAEYLNKGTNVYNERAIILNGITQMSEFPEAKLFPVDYSFQKELIENYQTPNIAFAVVESTVNFDKMRSMLYYILLPPLALYDWPFRIRGLTSTNFNLIVFDFNEFNVVGFKRYEIPGFTTKTKLEFVMYDFMLNLSTQPK